jgi:hypothetical protein
MVHDLLLLENILLDKMAVALKCGIVFATIYYE